MITIAEIQLPYITSQKHATIYKDDCITPKASILYFHGGGLLYGNRNDLPAFHINHLTQAGYEIIAFDYPLAPATKIDVILNDIATSIEHFLANKTLYHSDSLPYFLWGRSAGAYLCLLTGVFSKLSTPPSGVLSYYGYGFLCDTWFHQPNEFYKKLPLVSDINITKLSEEVTFTGDLETHYKNYVYARQTGNWTSLFYEGREKFFYLNYTLRTYSAFPYPLFCAHSSNDPDVPFNEFMELANRYHPTRFITSLKEHDFDRMVEEETTHHLLHETILFLDNILDSIF